MAGPRAVSNASAAAVAHTANAEYAEQLQLVQGCVAGDPTARARFDAEYAACLRIGVVRVCSDATLVEEIVQQLRVRMLGGADSKLATYSGRGPLRAWLQVVAARAALDALRSDARRRQHERSAPSAAVRSAHDIERDLERGRYSARFEHALRACLRALTVRERELLKLRVADALELEAIASHYGVHRASVARWLSALCSQLGRALRTELACQGAHLSASDVRGIGSLLRSRLGGAVDSWFERGSIRVLREDERA